LRYKAIFLDRDGVINEERKDYVKDIDEFEIINGSLDAIKFLKQKNFLVVIITNQSAVNRGLISIKKLNKIHSFLEEKLLDLDTSIDGIYFCPHTPQENCKCRKPEPGLLLKAVQDLNIDLEKSLMIGDSEKDIKAAENAGCKGILLNNNQKLIDVVKKLIL
jgi:D,D-heptose 1,7-bisphosphate phosphatase